MSTAKNYDLVIVGSTLQAINLAKLAIQINNDKRIGLVCDPQALKEAYAHYGFWYCLPSLVRHHQVGVQDFSLGMWLGEVARSLEENLSLSMLQGLGVDVITEDGFFEPQDDQNFQLRVRGDILRSPAYGLATGSTDGYPPMDHFRSAQLWTWDQLLGLDTWQALPKEIAIFSTDYRGVLLAQFFAYLQKKILLISPHETLLPSEDRDVNFWLEARLRVQGITCLTKFPMPEVEKLSHPMIFIGEQRGNLQEYRLNGLGLARKKGKILVDRHLQTSHPQFYAVGALCGGYDLPSLVALESRAAVRHALQVGDRTEAQVTYETLPYYFPPDINLARVGLSQIQAEERFPKKIHTLSRILSSDDPNYWPLHLQGVGRLVVKVIMDRQGSILGVYLLGDRAQELIHIWAIAIQAGLTLKDLLKLANHPLFAQLELEDITGNSS